MKFPPMVWFLILAPFGMFVLFLAGAFLFASRNEAASAFTFLVCGLALLTTSLYVFFDARQFFRDLRG